MDVTPEKLSLSIAKCEAIKTACGDAAHPCHRIVNTQKYLGSEFRQAPEPWAGNLSQAPILFIASNPSISEAEDTGEDYPLVSYNTAGSSHPDWDDERITDFHVNRFEQSRQRPFVIPEARFLCKDDKYRGSDRSAPDKGSQTYWRKAFQEASFLLGREIDISRHVCLTEVVHCKTKSETDKKNQPIGLDEALNFCASKYLLEILSLSPAIVVIVTGAFARNAILSSDQWDKHRQIRWDIDSDRFGKFPKYRGDASAHLGIAHINGTDRVVAAVRHLSNGYGCETFNGAYGARAASKISRFIQSVVAGTSQIPSTHKELLRALSLV